MEMTELENNQFIQDMINAQFDTESSVGYEQFQTKIVICDLSGEECRNGECCIGCKLAEDEVKSNMINDIIGLFPTIEKSRNEVGYKSNWNDSFNEFSSFESLKKALTYQGWTEKLINYTELPEGVKEQFHVWNECAKILSAMYKVTGYMYLDELPLIIVCTDRIFVEAPYSNE